MVETNYTYRHESFHLGQANDYTLALQVSSTRFTFAVMHDDKLMVLFENCPLDELLNPRELAEELLLEYKNVVAAIDPDTFTLIPVALYDEDKVAHLARYLDVVEDESVIAEQLDPDNNIIYKVKTEVHAAIEKFNPQRIVFGGKEWVNAIGATQPADNEIYLNIAAPILQLLNFKNNKIAFYNTFEYHTTDDLVYFVGLAVNALQIQQQDVKLLVSGAAQDLDQRLLDFFPVVGQVDLSTIELPDELKYDPAINLSALLLCASPAAH